MNMKEQCMTPTPKAPQLSAQHPEELHILFGAYVNAHDVDALMALYEPASTAVDLQGHLLQDPDTLRASLSALLSVIEYLDGTTRKVLMAGNVALLSSSWSAVLRAQELERKHVTGTSAEVARRQPDGTWLFVIDDPQFVWSLCDSLNEQERGGERSFL
jgi:ketosteroid isomerase-like protein